MKKMVKKNSAAKKMIPALGMLMVSASMLATSTYAWFTMSDSVTVTGMQLKATSDGGLLIINETDTDTAASWKTAATASYNAAAAVLLPTSTANTTNWYYNVSDEFNNAKAGQADANYVSISPVEGAATDGIYCLTTAAANNAGDVSAPIGNYYLLNNFYIKSSGEALSNGSLDVTTVKATVDGTTLGTEATALNKSLRVAVKVGSNNAIIFAPFLGEGDTADYKVGGSTGGTSVTAKKVTVATGAVAAADQPTGQTAIPANTAVVAAGANDTPAVNVKVYAFFEGEDTNCKSANTVLGLDTLKLELAFKWTPTA